MNEHHCNLRGFRKERDSESGGPDIEAGFVFSGAFKMFRIYISRDVKRSAMGLRRGQVGAVGNTAADCLQVTHKLSGVDPLRRQLTKRMMKV
jgi:hypothetical protein